MKSTKQVIVIRKDLKMRRGKEIAQGSHASMAFLTKHFLERPEIMFKLSYDGTTINLKRVEKKWLNTSFRKITCTVDSLDELLELDRKAQELGIESNVITDSGFTEFNGVPTITCLALGPDYDEVLNPITSNLKLY